MNYYDASNMDAEFVQCAVCDKAITGHKWFARIRHGRWMVALCCPLCTEVFEKNPDTYIHRIESIALMDSGGGIFKHDEPG